MPTESIVRRVDVTSLDDLQALCDGLEVSRDALCAVVEALGPAADSVRFVAMR